MTAPVGCLDEREAFEAWAAAEWDGKSIPDAAWLGWKARSASRQEGKTDAPNPWADCWYFVMDEAPLEFERIVTTYPPARWHDEAHKLMRAKHPQQAQEAQGDRHGE